MPSLRERKRYIAFEIISEQPITDFNEVAKAIWAKSLSYLGELGCAEAGIILLSDKYNKERQRGMLRVNNKSTDKMKSALSLITTVNNTNAIVRAVGVSGILNKAETKFVAS